MLVLDSQQYRYQIFISDLAGNDISSHDNSLEILINKVRDFLFNNSIRKSIASGAFVYNRFQTFTAALPEYCLNAHLDRNNLTFIAYAICVSEWLEIIPI